MKAKGVTVLAVSIDVDEGAYRQFVKNHNVNLITVRDPDQKVSKLYGTFGWPETYIIDRSGVMRRKFIGPVDWTDPEVPDFLGKMKEFPSVRFFRKKIGIAVKACGQEGRPPSRPDTPEPSVSPR